jgi:hypothetical protein
MKEKWIKSNSSDFDSLKGFITPLEAKGRTESAAFLIWLLQTIFRLDEVDAQDAVCDRKHDEGFDAIVVNDQGREIAVFQAKRRQKLPATLGDTDLKEFVGSLAHLDSKETVEHLAKTTHNSELRVLLEKTQVAEKNRSRIQAATDFCCERRRRPQR